MDDGLCLPDKVMFLWQWQTLVSGEKNDTVRTYKELNRWFLFKI